MEKQLRFNAFITSQLAAMNERGVALVPCFKVRLGGWAGVGVGGAAGMQQLWGSGTGGGHGGLAGGLLREIRRVIPLECPDTATLHILIGFDPLCPSLRCARRSGQAAACAPVLYQMWRSLAMAPRAGLGQLQAEL